PPLSPTRRSPDLADRPDGHLERPGRSAHLDLDAEAQRDVGARLAAERRRERDLERERRRDGADATADAGAEGDRRALVVVELFREDVDLLQLEADDELLVGADAGEERAVGDEVGAP